MQQTLFLEAMIDVLKAIAEPSRLRILALLRRGDLTVSDLTTILGQSQPRVSRHLKLLYEAGLISRYQEGAWAYFRLADSEVHTEICNLIISKLDLSDAMLGRDDERMEQVKILRQKKADAYFTANARDWDELRPLHVPDDAVNAAMLKIMNGEHIQSMLDVGTGTGTLLKLFSPLYLRGLGIDLNREMLSVARVNLDKAGILHAQVRQGDATALPVERDSFDLVTLYQVLHFLDNPQQALLEAARVLHPGGRLIIVDFASHHLEFLREEQAHRRLGFSDSQIESWLSEAGLQLKQTETFTPIDNRTDGLTVKLWFARDPRLLIAENKTMESA